MRNRLTLCWHYLRAFLLIYLCLLAGNGLSALLPVPIPGSIIGMLLLLLLLATHILPIEWVKPGCQLLIRYMTLLFVPISVSVMIYYPLLSSQWRPIVISSLVSTLIVMVVVAYSSHWVHRERPPAERSQEDKQP